MRAPFTLFVPGRIEVLGKHTDYAGGRSLTCATLRGMRFTVRPRSDAWLAIGPEGGEGVRLEIEPTLAARPGHWSDYPRTVARRLAANFAPPWLGADVTFTSDLPAAAGLSSSSALVTGVWLALATCNRLDERAEYRAALGGPEALADYLGCVENGRPFGPLGSFGPLAGEAGVGTLGGCEDHVAILCSRPGALRQYSYGPVSFERAIPLPPALTFAVAGSGVKAAKAASVRERYNRLSRATAEIAELWRRETGGDQPHLGAILASAPEAESRLAALLAARAGEGEAARFRVARFAAFGEEHLRIVPAAGDALAAGELARFGRLTDRSQRIAEEGLDNQVPETLELAALARRLGAHAASAFGGGFGGAVWALIDRASADDFLSRWRAHYLERFPARAGAADFFLTDPGAAAHTLG